MDNLFSTYSVFNEILFDCLEAYNQIPPKPEMEQGLVLLTSVIPLHDLPGLKVKIADNPLSRRMLDKKSNQIYRKLKQTSIYMLKNHDAEFYRNEEECQWAQNDFITYMVETTYWQKREIIGSMLSFLTIFFAILLCLHHKRIIFLS